jgi:glycosyltransferase involved in cell wall biosynthesis
VRVCLVYDCLFPHTVGGAERWYRNLAERLARDGHSVTYVTLRQWPRGTAPDVPGVRVVAAGPRFSLYSAPGRRRALPPLVFGLGVLWHLLRWGRRYDVVHTASFPYFSVLAAGVARRFSAGAGFSPGAAAPPARRPFTLVVDWHEVWTRAYWRSYLGRAGGQVGWLVQALCARVPQRAFCFSRLHASRLRSLGLRGPVTVLSGEYAGPMEPFPPAPVEPVVVFAGRHIPEKNVPALVDGFALARRFEPSLRLELFGEGPEFGAVTRRVDGSGFPPGVVVQHGFVSPEEVLAGLRRAACLVLPSSREGYGMVVVEAAACGTPSVVAAAPDSAAVELVAEGENGTVAASAAPADLAAGILRVVREGEALRERTRSWFAANARRLSLDASVETVAASYAPPPER